MGSLSYARSRQTSPEATVEFKAMIIAVFIHLFLLFFELFLCYQVSPNLIPFFILILGRNRLIIQSQMVVYIYASFLLVSLDRGGVRLGV